MEAAHRAAWRYALLLLLPLIASGGADGPVRFDSGADGSAVDTEGRSYVATKTGVQIFLSDGTAAGTIGVPDIRSASPSAGATTTCSTLWASHRSGRSRPGSTDSVSHPG